MNNKGFIATSLIYSFFLIFITLFLTIIADYLQNKVLLNTIEDGIKDTINSTKTIEDFDVGDILYFGVNATTLNSSITNGSTWVIGSIDFNDSKIILYSMDIEKGITTCGADCLTMTKLQEDLTISNLNNSTTTLISILNIFNFNDASTGELKYNYFLTDETSTGRTITKNCVKVVDNNYNYDDCTGTSDSNTKYRIRKEINVTNKKFTVKASGTNNFTVTGVS